MANRFTQTLLFANAHSFTNALSVFACGETGSRNDGLSEAMVAAYFCNKVDPALVANGIIDSANMTALSLSVVVVQANTATANAIGTNTNVNLSLNGNSDAIYGANYIYDRIQIAAGDTFVMDTEKLLMEPGDRIYAWLADNASGTVSVTINSTSI